jgi:pimeloyl-ACP methyl ester carboxylesterase
MTRFGGTQVRSQGVWLIVLLLLGCGRRTQLDVGTVPVVRFTPSGVAYDLSGEGRDLLLVHGFSADRRMWDGMRAPLVEAGFRVIRLDLRAHGVSGPSGPEQSNADDLAAVLDATGSRDVVIVGHSAGAAAAIELALSAPARVRGLVLVAPSVNGLRITTRMEGMSEVGRLVRAGQDSAATEVWLRHPAMELFGDAMAKESLRGIVRENKRVWRAAPPRAFTPSAWERAKEIRVPVRVVVGARDVTGTREVSDSLATRMALRMSVVDGAGHWVSLDRPEAVLRVVREFSVR